MSNEKIRQVFLEKFNHIVETGNIIHAEAKSDRYQQMLRHYIKIAKQVGIDNAIRGIESLEVAISNFIKTGYINKDSDVSN